MGTVHSWEVFQVLMPSASQLSEIPVMLSLVKNQNDYWKLLPLHGCNLNFYFKTSSPCIDFILLNMKQ